MTKVSIFYKKEIPVAFGYTNEVSPRRTVFCTIFVREGKMPKGLERSKYEDYVMLILSVSYDHFYCELTKEIPISSFEKELDSYKEIYDSVPNPLTLEWLNKKGFK